MNTNEYIFDIEADDLLRGITKIHCLCYSSSDGTDRGQLTSREDIEEFFKGHNIYIGHYVIPYDFKALTKIYGIERPKQYIDTLGLSWALEPNRAEYGLESYGEEFGIPKPPIKDWKNLTIEEYLHRCSTDVEINRLLWLRLKKKLQEIYS